MTLLAAVCGRLGDDARAAELYDLLSPFAGRNVIVGRAATCNGSVSRHLGILARQRAQVLPLFLALIIALGWRGDDLDGQQTTTAVVGSDLEATSVP